MIEMISSNTFIQSFATLLDKNKILSISGPSGTGKTTLALYLVGSLLGTMDYNEDCCAWVQASETFSMRRLETIFQANSNLLEYLKANFHVIPGRNHCKSLSEQENIICNLFQNDNSLPPFTRFIVVDNISHYLRFEISEATEKTDKFKLMNEFFDKQVRSLAMSCQKEGICLILIHEVTYNPSLNRNVPFFHKLYDRIDSIRVDLSKTFRSDTKKMSIALTKDPIAKELEYKLCESGFSFC